MLLVENSQTRKNIIVIGNLWIVHLLLKDHVNVDPRDVVHEHRSIKRISDHEDGFDRADANDVARVSDQVLDHAQSTIELTSVDAVEVEKHMLRR